MIGSKRLTSPDLSQNAAVFHYPCRLFAGLDFFSSLPLSYIVEAVNRADNFPSLILAQSYIHDDDNTWAIRTLDVNFPIMDARHLAGQDIAHRTLLMGHITAVRAVDPE